MRTLLLVGALATAAGVAGCRDSAVTACHHVCQTLAGCFSTTNLQNCFDFCDRAPDMCRNDKVVTDMLEACAESKCDKVVGCVIAVGAQYPQCNPNNQPADGGAP